mgnify:CR=1 FL=1
MLSISYYEKEKRIIPILFPINFDLKVLLPWKKHGLCDIRASKEDEKV